MNYSKEICEKIGDFFYKKYKELGQLKAELEIKDIDKPQQQPLYASVPLVNKYKEFLKENNIHEFSASDFYLCVNQKTENDIIVFRRDYKSVSTTVSGWHKTEILTTSIASNHVEEKIYILVPKDFAEKVIILEKLEEK